MKGEKVMQTGSYLLCARMLVLAVLVLVGLAPAKALAEVDPGKKRVCLVLRPDVKSSAGKDVVHVLPKAAAGRAVAAERQMSFFKGNMKKVGVGIPDCFTISSHKRPVSYAGSDAIHRDLNGYVEALSGDLEIRPFFPSAGYFSRSSRNGSSAIALGVGVRGPGTVPKHEEEGSPSAAVSLMIGFGF